MNNADLYRAREIRATDLPELKAPSTCGECEQSLVEQTRDMGTQTKWCLAVAILGGVGGCAGLAWAITNADKIFAGH